MTGMVVKAEDEHGRRLHIDKVVMYAKSARATINGRALAKIRETINAKDD